VIILFIICSAAFAQPLLFSFDEPILTEQISQYYHTGQNLFCYCICLRAFACSRAASAWKFRLNGTAFPLAAARVF
jgi:hypothetical protein